MVFGLMTLGDWNCNLGSNCTATLSDCRQPTVLVDGMLVSSKYERENGKSKKAKAAKVTFWSLRANSVRRLSRAEAGPPTAPSGSDAGDGAESGNAPF